MEFMGVGPLELLVILVVALVFVVPERLSTLAADARLIGRPICACTVAEGQTFCGSCGTVLRPAALAGMAEKRR